MIHQWFDRIGVTVIDVAMAAFAALAVAFVAIVMPDHAFAGLASASGLHGFLEAAEPPFPISSRAAAALAGGAATFVLVLLILRALGGQSDRPQFSFAPEPELPKVRRADAHPDAPIRMPVSAAREFGDNGPRAPMAISPAEEGELDNIGFASGDELLLETFAAQESAAALPEGEIEPSSAPLVPEPEPASETKKALPGESAVRPDRRAAPADDSIAGLMARLEQGIQRRAAPAASASDSPLATPAIDERLRGAIEDLQNLSTRSR